MTIEAELFNLFAEIIYGNLRFSVEMLDKFVRRGLTADSWPADGWPFIPRVMIVQDLLRLVRDILGDLPRLGMSGTVGSVWRCRDEARREGGRGGGRGGGGSGGRIGGGAGGGGGVDSTEWF